MSMSSWLTRLLVVVCMLALSAPSSLNAAAPPGAKIIESSPANKAWHLAASGRSAVLIDAGSGSCSLEVQKAQLKSGTRLVLESDAKTLLLSCGNASVPIQLPKTEGTIEIGISTDPNEPLLTVEGKENARTRGRWIEICTRQPEPIIRLWLGQVTYATATFAAGVAAAENESAAPAVPEPKAPASAIPATPTAPAPASHERALDRAKHAVFQIRTKDAKGNPIASGSGFLHAAGGFGITNYHVVSGASGASAVFAGEDKERSVELWAVRKDMDLALVKIGGGGKDIDARGTLTVGTEPAIEGEEVWALGFPLGLGYSVTRGVVNGIRPWAELPEPVRKAFPGVKSWVQTDCTINHGNSGGPLISTSGSLIGINTWYLEIGQNVYFAISATETAQLLKATTQKPVTFAAVSGDANPAAQQGNYKSVAADLPRIDIKRIGTADQLRSAIVGMTTGLSRKCATCGGDGIDNVKVTVGRTRTGRPIQGSGERRCPTCGGRGYVLTNPQAASKITGRFCTALATLNPEDPKAERTLNDAYAALTGSLRGSPVATGALNEQAASQLAQRSLKPQDPFAVAAFYILGGVIENSGPQTKPSGKSPPASTTTTTTSSTSHAGERVHFIKMLGGDQVLAILAPRLDDQVLQGPVFVGGLMSGEIKLPDGVRVIVLQGGFIVKATAERIGYDPTPTPRN